MWVPDRSIRVVAGMYMRGDNVLLGKRKATGLRPGLWEMPGGKLERGESSEQALRREWLEETDLEIEVGDFVCSSCFTVEQTIAIDLFWVWASELGREPKALDHDELRWVRIDYAVQKLPMSPAFYLHYPHIKTWLSLRGLG